MTTIVIKDSIIAADRKVTQTTNNLLPGARCPSCSHKLDGVIVPSTKIFACDVPIFYTRFDDSLVTGTAFAYAMSGTGHPDYIKRIVEGLSVIGEHYNINEWPVIIGKLATDNARHDDCNILLFAREFYVEVCFAKGTIRTSSFRYGGLAVYGSGSLCATVAAAGGLGASEAVHFATQFDSDSGIGVDWFDASLGRLELMDGGETKVNSDELDNWFKKMHFNRVKAKKAKNAKESKAK